MEKSEKTMIEEIRGTLDEIINQIRAFIREGNARRVIVKNKQGKVLFQSQLTLGVAGTTFFVVYAPVLTAITTLILYASDVRVFVERDIDESENERDEYEVDAQVIEIEDDENDDDKGSEKTVGKK